MFIILIKSLTTKLNAGAHPVTVAPLIDSLQSRDVHTGNSRVSAILCVKLVVVKGVHSMT